MPLSKQVGSKEVSAVVIVHTACLRGRFLPQVKGLSEEHMEILAYIMHRVALLCRTRGLNFKNCFRNYDVANALCGRVHLGRSDLRFRKGRNDALIDIP